VTSLLSPAAKAVNYTDTNPLTTWSSNTISGFASNGAVATPWDSVNGSNSVAIFTNKSVQTVTLSGTNFLNTINNGNGGGNNSWTNTFTNGTLVFVGTNATMFDGANSTSGSLAIYYSSIVTATNLSMGGSSTGGTTALFGSNVFSNGTIGISTLLGNNTAAMTAGHLTTVYGTNFGGSYVIGYGNNITGTLTVYASSNGLITNATAITAYQGSTVNYINTNITTGASNNAFGSTTITLNAGTFAYSAAASTNAIGNIAGLSLLSGVTSFLNTTAGNSNTFNTFNINQQTFLPFQT
jgi:hypothetical protein